MLDAPSLWTILTQPLWALLCLLACGVLGAALVQTLQGRSNAVGLGALNLELRWFFTISLGLAAVTLVLFVVGLVGLLHPGVVLPVLVVLLGWALWRTLRAARGGGASTHWLVGTRARNDAPGVGLALLLLGVSLCLVWISVRAPGMWDDTSYHLPYARHYLQQQAITVQPYLRFPLFPHNANLLLALGLMGGSVLLAQLLATLPLLVAVLGLSGAARLWLRSDSAAWVAVLVFVTLGPVRETLGFAYVDNVLVLWCWASVLALALALRTHPAPQGLGLLLAGVFAGLAAGTKLFGAVLAVFTGLFLLLALRRWGPALRFGALALVVGVWWYVRSLLISGDPVHPALGNVLGHYLWNAADLASQHAEQATHGAERNPLWLARALFKADLGVLLCAVLVLLQPGGQRRPLVFVGTLVLAYTLFWFETAQVARYLAPVLAPGALLAVVFAWQAGLATTLRRWNARSPRGLRLLFAAVLPIALGAGLALGGVQHLRQQVAGWDASLQGRAGFTVLQKANTLRQSPDEVLLQVGFENAVFFYEGTAIGDWFGPGRYDQTITCSDRCRIVAPEALRAVAQRFGARLVALNGDRFGFEPAAYESLFRIEHQAGAAYLLSLR